MITHSTVSTFEADGAFLRFRIWLQRKTHGHYGCERQCACSYPVISIREGLTSVSQKLVQIHFMQIYCWDYVQLVAYQTTATSLSYCSGCCWTISHLYCTVQDLKYALCSKYHWLLISGADWLLDLWWGSWLQCRRQLGRYLFGIVQRK